MAGRPRIFETVEELQKKVDEYFQWIKGEKKIERGEDGKVISEDWERYPEPATVTGIALFLGFESRQSFYDYEANSEFSYTIKKARLKVENEYEKNLSGNNCAGSIFALKNLGWKDKSETELSGGFQIEQITGMRFKDDAA